jgi:hypothetical protein
VSGSFWNGWSVLNTSIATVQAGGYHHGVSMGSTTSQAVGSLSYYHTRLCPTRQFQPGGNVSVLSSNIISFAAAGCGSTFNYGIELAIKYQVLDQSGNALASSKMEPQEKDLNLIINGTKYPDDTAWGDLGPSAYAGTSKFTDSNGQFLDAPVGSCVQAPFTQTDTQVISILMNGTRYPVSTDPNAGVRANNWTTKSSSSGHGSITNGSDVSKSQ